MNENIATAAVFEESDSAATSARALKTVVSGGLTVGLIDCLAATVNAGLRGVSFSQVWQYVASGLLGRNSYDYGWISAALGLLIHFLIAFSVVTVYYAASRRLPFLIRRAFLFGSLYGIAVYFFMGYLVSPLSRTTRIPFSFRGLLTGLFIHVLCVGLPAALITRWFAKRP
jgi:hypothetical protein